VTPVQHPRVTLFVGDRRGSGESAHAEARRMADALPGARIVAAPPAEHWPFMHPFAPPLPAGPVVVLAVGVDRAFEQRQAANTRLVTTQAQYLFTEWQRTLDAHGTAWLVASADHGSVRRHAEDLLLRRGIFARLQVTIAPEGDGVDETPVEAPESVPGTLARAFREADAAERLRRAVDALAHGRTAPALVATASVCQEVSDLESAARDLDEAIALAPDWAAAHFERGKVWLRLDRMEDAARSFRAAAEQLPGFGAAWGNLGATLGELDRPAEALAAFEQLLALDPSSPQAVNNIGVVTRELGRLGESEASFRRVVELEPNLAFGYYNLGHTLFLQGRYHAAAGAYAQGQTRDPERNPVQGSRLAMCLVATGDARGALTELQRATGTMPRDYRKQLLGDTSAILWALVTQKPELTGWQPVHDWLRNELAKLA
jgi:tetratricopeptide (TPR) repeat protein